MHPETTPGDVSERLTETQRKALCGATVKKSTILKNYYMLDMPCCGMSGQEAENLVKLGLVSLPIRSGPRCGPSTYHGEIHALGLAVRAHLERQTHDL